MNADKMKRAGKHLAWGLLATCWNGGWAAVSGVLGIDAVALTGADAAVTGAASARILNLHEMIAAFCGAFVLNGVLWFIKHPLPQDLDTDPPFDSDPAKPSNP